MNSEIDSQATSKAKLIDQFKAMPIVLVACERAGVPRPNYYRWIRDDATFRKAVEKAKAEGRNFLNDLGEAQMVGLMKDKNWPSIKYYLEHHHPSYMKKEKSEDQRSKLKIIMLHDRED